MESKRVFFVAQLKNIWKIGTSTDWLYFPTGYAPVPPWPLATDHTEEQERILNFSEVPRPGLEQKISMGGDW